MPLLRSFLAGFVGLLVSAVVVAAFEYVNSLLYPFPAGFDMHDPAAIAAFIKTLPVTAYVAVWAGWAVGAFVGTLVAKKLSPTPSNRPAIAVGVLFALFCIMNMAMLPHPIAFVVASLVTTPLASFAALKLASRQAA
jgi:hypothetical protein